MNRKKLFLVFLLLLFFSLSLFAHSFNELVEKAKSESEHYKNTVSLSLKSLYSAELLNYDKEHKFSLGVKSGSWSENLEDRSKSAVSFTPYFSYESKEDNTTTIDVSSPISLYYMDNLINTDSTYSPSLTISQRVLLDGVKDESSDLNKKISILRARSTLSKTELQYEITLFNAISNVLSTESAYESAKVTYEKAKLEFEGIKNSDNLKENTYAYNKNYNEVLTSENSMIKAENTYSTALENFKNVAGFSWDGCSNITETTIEFVQKQNGNTDVELARLEMEAAKNEYEVLERNDNRVLSLNANTNGLIQGQEAKSWSVGGGASYKDTNFTLSVGAGGTFKSSNNWVAEPSVNFEFNYQSGNYENEAKRLKLQSALLNYRSKSYDYENEVINYNTKALTMLSNINAKKIENVKAKSEWENAVKDYENAVSLNENGYYSTYSFEGEKAKYKKAENTYKEFLLSLLILKREAEILNI